MEKSYKKSIFIVTLLVITSFAGITQGSSNSYCRIISPSNGQVVSDVFTIRILSCPASYDVHIDVQELNTGNYVQQSLKATYITGDLFKYDWDTTTLSDGAYVIKAGAHGDVSNHVIVNIDNFLGGPPNKPDISGPNNGCDNVGYTFTATSVDPEGNDIYYCWDYNKDHKVDERLGPFSSGVPCSNIVEFYDIGTNFVSVFAEDASDGSTSIWATHTIDIEDCSDGKRVENGAGAWCTIGLGSTAIYEIRLTEPPVSGSVTVTVTSSNPSYVSVVDIGKIGDGTVSWGYSSAVFDSADDYYRVKLKGLQLTDDLPNGKVKVTWDADDSSYLDDVANIQVVGGGGNSGGDGPYSYPAQAFAGGPYVGYVNEPITFKGSTNRYEQVFGCRWDFDGDGVFDTPWIDSIHNTGEVEVLHSYPESGVYTVIFQIKDGITLRTDTTQVWVVNPGDEWPFLIVNFTYTIPTTHQIPNHCPSDDPEMQYVTVKFDANCQNLLHSLGIRRYHWDFGDGSTATTYPTMGPAGGPYDIVEHTYEFPSSVPDDWVIGFNVKLTIFIHGYYDTIEYSETVNKTVIVNPIDFPEIDFIHLPLFDVSYRGKVEGTNDLSNNIKAIAGDTVEFSLDIKYENDWDYKFEQLGSSVTFDYPQVAWLSSEPYVYPDSGDEAPQVIAAHLSGSASIQVWIDSGYEDVVEIIEVERGGDLVWVYFDVREPDIICNLHYRIRVNGQNYRFKTEIRTHRTVHAFAYQFGEPITPEFKIRLPDNLINLRDGAATINGVPKDFYEVFRPIYKEFGNHQPVEPIPGIEPDYYKYIDDTEINLGESIHIEFKTTAVSLTDEGEFTEYPSYNYISVYAGGIWITEAIPKEYFFDGIPHEATIISADPSVGDSVQVKVDPIIVEKKIWDPSIQYWDEIAEVFPDDIVKFKCTVKTPIVEKDGDSRPEDYYFMKGAEFVDHLPYYLQYIETTSVTIRDLRIDSGADHSPPPMNPDYDVIIDGEDITWKINEAYNAAVGKTNDDQYIYEEIFNQIEIIFEAKVISIGFGLNKFGMDDFTLLRPGSGPMPYPWSERFPSYYTWPYEEIIDRAYPRVQGEPNPRMQVNLKAWNDYEAEWVEELYTAPVGTLVKFNITITNIGNMQLSNLKVNNIFCSLFQFGDPDSMDSRNTVQLYYPSLIPGESISYELEAELSYQGQGTNDVYVNATIILPELSGINPDGTPFIQYIESGSAMKIIATSRVPVISNPQPADGSSWVSINLPFVRAVIEDPEGDYFEWEISTYPDVGTGSNPKDVNGTKTCSLGYLNQDTTYTWIVKATDPESGFYSTNVFSFTTEEFTGPRPPYTYDDQASTEVNTPVTIDILHNDQDDGTINPSTVEITLDPLDGTITEIDSHTGRVTYTPYCDFEGVDTFRYTVKDDEGLTSNAAVVTITVGDSDDPPVPPEEVTVELLTPLENSLYFLGQFRREFPLTVVIGSISLEANITNITGVTKVAFFLDDIELCNYTDISETAYSCNLNGRTFGFKTIKVAAYAGGTELASEELDVIVFIFGTSLIK